MNQYRARSTAARSAFEEFGCISLADHSMESVLQLAADLTQGVVPGADAVSVSLVSNGTAQTTVSTGDLAMQLDRSQVRCGQGPSLDAMAGTELVIVTDVRRERRWPDYVGEAVMQGSSSSVSLAVRTQRQLITALTVYGRDAHAFDPDSVELCVRFASYVAVAAANMFLAESHKQRADELRTAMKSRALIEQAKGIVMAERRCTPSAAFEIMQERSSRSNRRVRDIAKALVDKAVKGG